ncbi:MAG: ABC transporter substrate-binding protein, partial [Gemmatimonadaceae bacterium]|nr:ABC transporter substrate-binding protein [Acetobacteraceae bacterium]
VAAFKAEYRRSPSPYAAVAYDTARLIAAALDKTGGQAADRAALHAALVSARFESVRGPFRFGANQFPVQNYYLTQVVRRADGEAGLDLRGDIFQAHADSYGDACKMRPF